MEFMISGIPNEPSNIVIPSVPASCDIALHTKQGELMTLSDNIGKQLAMQTWIMMQVTTCIMDTQTEYMDILAARMSELTDA